MTKREKERFELINDSLWLLIKKYIKDDKPYKDIMKDLFSIYMVKERAADKFSEKWWQSLIELYDCPERYSKNQRVCEFGADMADCIFEYFKGAERGLDSNYRFYKHISKAFLNEWGRLKDEKEDKEKTT